jgi:hypothetical protein
MGEFSPLGDGVYFKPFFNQRSVQKFVRDKKGMHSF